MAASSSSKPPLDCAASVDGGSQPESPELTLAQSSWLDIDSDSDHGFESGPIRTAAVGGDDKKPTQNFKRVLGRAGRPRGDAEFQQRMQVLIDMHETEHERDDEQVNQETAAQKRARVAREAKKTKAEQKNRSSTAVIPKNTDGILETMHQALTCYDQASDLHIVGTPLQKSIMAVAFSLRSRLAETKDEDDEAVELVRFFLEDPKLASTRSISKMLNASRYKVQTVGALTGASLVEANSWMTGAFFRSLHQRFIGDDPDFLPWVWLTSLRYDETPMKLRVREGEGACTQAKVVQVEFKWMCLLKANSAKAKQQFQHAMVESDVLTYLVTVDHQTAETLFSVTSSVMNIPEIERSLSSQEVLFNGLTIVTSV